MTTQPPHSGGQYADQDALVSEFLKSSRELIAAQRDVLLTYFGGAATVPPRPVPVAASASKVLSEEPQVPEASGDLEPPSAIRDGQPATTAAPPGSEGDVLRTVVEVIAERTGYPADMIDPELDLEADLSVDSIKRTEIVGELARRLSAGSGADLAALPDEELEDLSRARTAAAITAWLTTRLGHPSEPADETAVEITTAPAADSAQPPEAICSDGPPAVVGHDPARFVLQAVPLPEPTAAHETLAGKRFALLGSDDAGTVEALSERLASYGAQVVPLAATHQISAADGPVDGVLLLDPLHRDGQPVLPGCVPALQAALACSPRWLLVARAPAEGCGDGRSYGLRGLLRTLAREYPEVSTRLVEIDAADPGRVADTLIGELLADDREPVVLHDPAGRRGLALVDSDLGVLGHTGAGPAGEGAAEAIALGLDQDAVVLLVGGARGITARCAAAFASAGRCRLELLGRTAPPDGPEDPGTAAASDRTELRAVLARQGLPLREVDRTASRLLAQREVAATLDELSARGSRARYRVVDVLDPAALRQAVQEVHTEYGRLDGVVYAAGVIEDKVFAEKDSQSFQRVFAAKADGARALLDALAELPDGPRFTVLFGSISAVLGNQGQADYAAANDALEELADRWARRTGNRAVTVHWGPWAPLGLHGGMVSPEVARDYARRGVQLIDPEAGALALLRELAWGEESVRSVVYTASGW